MKKQKNIGMPTGLASKIFRRFYFQVSFPRSPTLGFPDLQMQHLIPLKTILPGVTC
jgi:hypothetical protein